MMQDEGPILTPREFDYWKLTYRELIALPEWSELSAEARAQKLLDRINEKLSEADAPPQRGVLFSSSEEENLKTVRRMIEHFEEDRS